VLFSNTSIKLLAPLTRHLFSKTFICFG